MSNSHSLIALLSVAALFLVVANFRLDSNDSRETQPATDPQETTPQEFQFKVFDWDEEPNADVVESDPPERPEATRFVTTEAPVENVNVVVQSAEASIEQENASRSSEVPNTEPEDAAVESTSHADTTNRGLKQDSEGEFLEPVSEEKPTEVETVVETIQPTLTDERLESKVNATPEPIESPERTESAKPIEFVAPSEKAETVEDADPTERTLDIQNAVEIDLSVEPTSVEKQQLESSKHTPRVQVIYSPQYTIDLSLATRELQLPASEKRPEVRENARIQRNLESRLFSSMTP